MTDSTTTPTPTKPVEAMSEDEIRSGPDFQDLRSRMPEEIKDEQVLSIARNILKIRWESVRDARRDEVIGDFVSRLLEVDPSLEKVTQIVLTRGEDGLSVEFKKARAPRWSEDTYAEHLGEFTKEYRSEKHAEASGVYTLRIAEGRNADEKVSMEVTEPSGRVLAFPPVDADNQAGRLANGDVDPDADRVECSSISRLLRDSKHATTLSVWQYFGLKREESNEG